MTRPGSHRSRLVALLAVLMLAVGAVPASALDCSALRAEIDALGPPTDPAQADAALRRQRDEIVRTRDLADRTGCGDGFFDDPDSAPCRTLARRISLLQVELQRLQDHAFHGAPADDARRSDLQATFDAQCSPDRGSVDRADAGDAPVTTVPVDPDAPAGFDAPATPVVRTKASRVICVRHCDGAFYPLAVDVASDRMPDMDRICQAQCPSAESSAYAGGDGDVAGTTATDGSPYSALPTAFKYLQGPTQACACRAPHQSWAAALAGAEALLQPQKGDVTVTAALAAARAQPGAAPQAPVTPAAAKPAPAKRSRARTSPNPPTLTVPGPVPDQDLTREFRGSDPTL